MKLNPTELHHLREDLEQRAVNARTPAETFALMEQLRQLSVREQVPIIVARQKARCRD